MRIAVVMGRVLDPAGIVVNRRRGRLFVNREEYILQPADRCALEAALRIKDTTSAEVVVLPRSPLPDDDVLRQALAVGADRAVYVKGTEFTSLDDAVMAAVLCAAVERAGGADMVLTGATTMDTGQSQLAARLAEELGWPQILNAWQVETVDGRALAVQKHGSLYVRVKASLPAVITLTPGALRLRYADGARLVNVYRAGDAVEEWDAADLLGGSPLQPLLALLGQEYPPERELGTRLDGSAQEMAQTVAEALGRRV